MDSSGRFQVPNGVDTVAATSEIGDVNNMTEKTELKFAIEQRNTVAVQKLLQAGAEVNTTYSSMRTPLMFSAEKGNVEILLVLLKAGAKLDLLDETGQTALMLAAQAGHTECVECLIKSGARQELQDRTGKTALILAAAGGHCSCLQSLLRSGENLKDLRCKKGKTALFYASEALSEDCMHELIKSGADMNIMDGYGLTVLTNLIVMTNQSEGATRCLQILLEAGASIFADPFDDMTPLIYAARFDLSARFFNELVQAGEDLHATRYRGMTALAYAASEGNLEYVKRLIDGGADINMADNDGRTALIHALKRQVNIDYQRRLHFDASITDADMDEELYVAFAHNNNEEVRYNTRKYLLDHGADVNVKNKQGQTPLMLASSTLDINTLSMMLSHGAHINMTDNYECSALNYALDNTSYHNQYTNFKFLLENGASPNLKTRAGRSVLWRALHCEIVILESLLKIIPYIDSEYFISFMNEHDKRKLQLLVQNGIMPSLSDSLVDNDTSPSILVIALGNDKLGAAKFCLAVGYLNVCDTIHSRLNSKMETCTRFSYIQPQLQEFYDAVYSQPWPLVKLCFVAASSLMGASPDREKRVRQSGLPDLLQRMLLFKEPISKLCVSQWDSIPFCFSPDDYENLSHPHPLLLYWPFGRALVPCGCGRCGDDGVTFC